MTVAAGKTDLAALQLAGQSQLALNDPDEVLRLPARKARPRRASRDPLALRDDEEEDGDRWGH